MLPVYTPPKKVLSYKDLIWPDEVLRADAKSLRAVCIWEFGRESRKLQDWIQELEETSDNALGECSGADIRDFLFEYVGETLAFGFSRAPACEKRLKSNTHRKKLKKLVKTISDAVGFIDWRLFLLPGFPDMAWHEAKTQRGVSPNEATMYSNIEVLPSSHYRKYIKTSGCCFKIRRQFGTQSEYDGLLVTTTPRGALFKDSSLLSGRVDKLNLVDGEHARVVLVGKHVVREGDRKDATNSVTDMLLAIKKKLEVEHQLRMDAGKRFVASTAQTGFNDTVAAKDYAEALQSAALNTRVLPEPGMVPLMGGLGFGKHYMEVDLLRHPDEAVADYTRILNDDEFVGFFVFDELLKCMTAADIWYSVWGGFNEVLGRVPENNQKAPIFKYRTHGCRDILQRLGALRASKCAHQKPMVSGIDIEGVEQKSRLADWDCLDFIYSEYGKHLKSKAEEMGMNEPREIEAYVAARLKEQPLYARYDQFKRAANLAFDEFQHLFPSLKEAELAIAGTKCPF